MSGDSVSSWSPSDLGLDVPDALADVEVSNEEIKVDVDELDEDTRVRHRDPDQLAECRDNALDRARQFYEFVEDEDPDWSDSATDVWRLSTAEDYVIGALRAEYLRRQIPPEGGVDS